LKMMTLRHCLDTYKVSLNILQLNLLLVTIENLLSLICSFALNFVFITLAYMIQLADEFFPIVLNSYLNFGCQVLKPVVK